VATDGGGLSIATFAGSASPRAPWGPSTTSSSRTAPGCGSFKRRPPSAATAAWAAGPISTSSKAAAARDADRLCRREEGAHLREGPVRLARLRRPLEAVGPRIRRDGALRQTGWGDAVGYAAKALDEIRRSRGASSLALLTADHLTTEEARACGALFRDTLGCTDIGSLQAAGYRQILSVLSAELGPTWEPATLQGLSEAETLIVLGGGAAELHPTLKPLVNGLMRKEGRELVVLSSWPDTLTRRATLALTITAGYAEDFFAELRGALSAERTRASADIARFGVDTCGLARLISLLGEDRKTTVLVAPDPFGDNLQRARLAALLHGRTRSILPLGPRSTVPALSERPACLPAAPPWMGCH